MNGWIWWSNSLLLSAVLLLYPCGCAAVSVTKEEVGQVVEGFQVDVVTHKELSQISLQYMRMHDLDATAAEDPVAFFRSLQRTAEDDRITKLYTLAEYALKVAVDLEDSKPEVAGDWFLLAADQAYQGTFLTLRTGRADWDYRGNRLRAFYRRAVAGFVLSLRERGHGALGPFTRVIAGEKYSVSVARGAQFLDPNEFEELLFADELQFTGLSNRHRAFGFGVPFVGFRENRRQQPVEEFYSKAGIVRGLSAHLTFTAGRGKASRDVSLAFYDARNAESAMVEGVEVPLSADYTAPFGYLVSKVQRGGLNIAGTFHPEATLGETGYVLTEPYDAGRIPIVTLHGLFSHPLTWVDVQNDLMADPLIRKHYQFWHFNYPPGLPLLESSRLFREKTEELYAFFDPEGKSKALNSAVIVSHSMGGLLAKTVVTDSGNKLYEAYFDVPVTELKVSPEDKAKIREVLFFESRPYVKRIVYIAVPHRGSHIPDNFIGWSGRMLTSTPSDYAELIDDIRSKVPARQLEDEAEAAVQDDMNSIKNLAPDDPALQALSELPIDAAIPFHSIIGDQGIGNGQEGSDGVVAYKSSHLEGAESELIVPTNHGAHVHPLTILELKRILKLHLDQLGSN